MSEAPFRLNVPIPRTTKVAELLTPRPVEKAAESAPVVPNVPGKSLIDTMNDLLTSEFEAIHQYLCHYAVMKNAGYEKLAAYLLAHLNDEKKHADMLAYRIVFLGGTPMPAGKLDSKCGKTATEQFDFDQKAEQTAVKNYNAAIKEAVEAGDNVTREMFESIVKDEDHHVDEITTFKAMVAQMGIGPFLVTQV